MSDGNPNPFNWRWGIFWGVFVVLVVGFVMIQVTYTDSS